MRDRDDSGLRPTPELEAMFSEQFRHAAEVMIEAGKSALYSNLSRVSVAGSFAVSFIENQARNPCPHGGADATCECYPHQARRWLVQQREATS